MATNGFKAVENRIERLFEMLNPPSTEPIIINLIERYTDNGNDVVQIAIQPKTGETFLVVEEEDNSFDFHL